MEVVFGNFRSLKAQGLTCWTCAIQNVLLSDSEGLNYNQYDDAKNEQNLEVGRKRGILGFCLVNTSKIQIYLVASDMRDTDR